jgi:hypothetical protein
MSRGQFGFKADRLAIGGDCLVEGAIFINPAVRRTVGRLVDG